MKRLCMIFLILYSHQLLASSSSIVKLEQKKILSYIKSGDVLLTSTVNNKDEDLKSLPNEISRNLSKRIASSNNVVDKICGKFKDKYKSLLYEWLYFAPIKDNHDNRYLYGKTHSRPYSVPEYGENLVGDYRDEDIPHRRFNMQVKIENEAKQYCFSSTKDKEFIIDRVQSKTVNGKKVYMVKVSSEELSLDKWIPLSYFSESLQDKKYRSQVIVPNLTRDDADQYNYYTPKEIDKDDYQENLVRFIGHSPSVYNLGAPRLKLNTKNVKNMKQYLTCKILDKVNSYEITGIKRGGPVCLDCNSAYRENYVQIKIPNTNYSKWFHLDKVSFKISKPQDINLKNACLDFTRSHEKALLQLNNWDKKNIKLKDQNKRSTIAIKPLGDEDNDTVRSDTKILPKGSLIK